MTGKPSDPSAPQPPHMKVEGESQLHKAIACVCVFTATTHGLAFLAVMNSPLGGPRVVFSLKLSSECNDWSLEDKEVTADGSRAPLGSNQDNASLAKKVSPLTTGLGGTSSCDTNLGSALMHPWGTVALRVLGGEEREEKEKGKRRKAQ